MKIEEPEARFGKTFAWKILILSAGLGIVAIFIRLISGETEQSDWVETVLLWAIACAGMATFVRLGIL
jgi:hypothetical protein